MSKQEMRFLRGIFAFLIWLPLSTASWAAHVNTPATNTAKSKTQKINETQRTRRRLHHLASSRSVTPASGAHLSSAHPSSAHLSASATAVHRRRYQERFHMSSFAEDITEGDAVAGEDTVVRQAALDALGNMNGTVVAIEPTSGRVLAMVNQKLALSSGAQPCSTIKLSVALAALNEGLVSKDTEVALGAAAASILPRRWRTPTISISKLWDASWALRKSLTTRMNTGSAS